MQPQARPGFLITALVVLTGMLLAGIFAIWLFWSVTFWAVDKAVDFVPPSWEAEFGKQAMAEMDGHGIEDPLLREAVARITAELVEALPADTPYKFTMTPVWKEEANAFALPGGYMMVTSQLLAEAESPDEVAGVLGHEIGHVLHRHGFRSIAREQGMALILALTLGDDGTIATIAKGGHYLANLSNSREHELEADRTGVKLAYEAGFQPKAMGDFFRRQQAAAELGETAERALAFLSTHPANADRLAQLEKIAQDLPARPRSDFRAPARWNVIRRRAAAIPAEYREQKAEGGS